MAPGNKWVESVVWKGQSVKDAFPISWVGARGWEAPAPGVFWPRVASSIDTGYTGQQQTQRLQVRFERWCA